MEAMRIGIAGFMGAGKSTCAGFMSERCDAFSGRARIVDADAEAKLLMQGNEVIKRNLVETFGPAIISAGALVFAELGEAAFGSAENLNALNGIVHPALVKALEEKVFVKGGPCIVFDAALIPLWHIEKWFDVLVWVRAPFDKRYERLKNKTNLPAAKLVARMELQQALFDEPIKAPWNIIENHGTLEDLKIKSLSCILSQREELFP
jgi:dephospho-CoA kinase